LALGFNCGGRPSGQLSCRYLAAVRSST
jgi:hypothetical protein